MKRILFASGVAAALLATTGMVVADAGRAGLRRASTTNYQLQIKTADESGAGTDSNIYVSVRGEFGRSDEVRLNPLIHHNAFERNSTEVVNVNGLPDLGRIYQVDVRSDNRYWASDWRLSWIRVFPSNPAYAPSVFHYDGWIGDTTTRNLTADDWPWPLQVIGQQPDSDVVVQMNLVNLLDASQSLQRNYKVTFQIQDQVQVSTDVKTTDDLKNELKWSSPDALSVIGKLDDTLTTEWKTELDKKAQDQTQTTLTTEDTHTMTFPAGQITLIETDWREPWLQAVGKIGSVSMGIRWLQTMPTASWTVGSYAKGSVVPEPFASWLRTNYPSVAPLFKLPIHRLSVQVDAVHNTLMKIAAWKLGSQSQWLNLYKWNKLYFTERNIGVAKAARYPIEPGTIIYYGVTKPT